MRSRRHELAAWACTLIAAAVLGGEVYAQRHNTLRENGRWTSAKAALGKGVMGAAAYMTTRVALAERRLDLGAWWGFQEILYREPIELERADFDLSVPDGAYVIVVAEAGETGFLGIRLSRRADHPSIVFQADGSGRFLAQRPLEVALAGRDRHHVGLASGADGVTLDVDGRAVPVRPERLRPGRFGFRGGCASAAVDDVVIRARGAAGPIHERFGPAAGRRTAVPAAAALAGLVNLLLGAAIRRREERWLLVLALANGAAAVAFAVVLVLDARWLAGRYPLPTERVDERGFENRIEDVPAVRERLRRTYPAPTPAGTVRVLFLGTSQTWGAGARSEDETFVSLLERRLAARLGPDRRVECVNAGVPGTTAGWVVQYYQADWLPLQPQLVVADLSNNDADPQALARALEHLVRLNRARGIATLFVEEPNSPECPMQGIEERHRVMRETGTRLGVRAVPLHALLAARSHEGLLWWDFVHPTSFGHQAIADLLEAPILEELGRLGIVAPAVRDPSS